MEYDVYSWAGVMMVRYLSHYRGVCVHFAWPCAVLPWMCKLRHLVCRLTDVPQSWFITQTLSDVSIETVAQCVCVEFEHFIWVLLKWYLDAFANVRKATISAVMSVRMEQLGSHWTNFYETSYLSFFRKCFHEMQVSLKSDKNNGYFTCRRFHIYGNISLNSS